MSAVLEIHDLVVLAEGYWPEPDDDVAAGPPALPGFVLSTFNPLAAVAADRCLTKRPQPPDGITGIVLVSDGDRVSAEHVQQAVADGKRIGPLFFFQSVPNSVAGLIAAKWDLRGPVVCVTDGGLDEAALLIGDGDADQVLIVEVRAEQAAARIVSAGARP
ncbi:beta-ketoacyl synthase chain length factor [Kribbella sp. CA-247076]|uniref:beta-ketoacyl synthase chain length factor n=1 Tax=Kribbella sp. CA-247076 TaxID=3239941 RepID=UPI003D9498E2